MQGDASYTSVKEFYHIPSLALFTATVFICHLLVNRRSASQEAVIREVFDVAWLIWLFFCIFSQQKFNLIEPCRKLTYLCTLSLKRNASRVFYDTVSPRCTSWRSEKKGNVVGKYTFWTEMKFTENLNPRKLQICDIYCLKSHVRRNTKFWIFGRNGGRSKKVDLELSSEKSTFPCDK